MQNETFLSDDDKFIKSVLDYYKYSLEVDATNRFELQEECEIFQEGLEGESQIRKIVQKYDNNTYDLTNNYYFFSELHNRGACESIFNFCKEKEESKEINRFKFYFSNIRIKKLWELEENVKNKKIVDEEKLWICPFFIEIGQDKEEYEKILKKEVSADLYYAKEFFENYHSKEQNGEKMRIHSTPIEFYSKIFLESLEMVDSDKNNFIKKCNEECKLENLSLEEIKSYTDYRKALRIILSKILNRNVEKNDNSQECVYEFYSKMFFGLTGESIGEFSKFYKENINFKPILIVLDSELEKKEKNEKIINSFLKLYRQIKNNGIAPSNKLIKNFFRIYNISNFENSYPEEYRLHVQTEDNIKLSKKQLGSFEYGKKALTSSQRYCLQMTETNLDIIPINGPPGTGKTSLLKGLIANYLVNCAFEIKDKKLDEIKYANFSPPLVVFSTNNKALINVSEGLNDAFFELEQQGEKIKVGYNLENYDSASNLNSSIGKAQKSYVPLIKRTVKNQSEKNFMELDNLLEFRFKIKDNIDDYIKYFISKAIENYESFFKNIKKDLIRGKDYLEIEVLKIFIKNLSRKLDENKNKIEQRLDNIDLNLHKNFETNKRNLIEISQKYKNYDFNQEVKNVRNREIMIKSIERMSRLKNHSIIPILTEYEEQLFYYGSNLKNLKGSIRICVDLLEESIKISKNKFKKHREKKVFSIKQQSIINYKNFINKNNNYLKLLNKNKKLFIIIYNFFNKKNYIRQTNLKKQIHELIIEQVYITRKIGNYNRNTEKILFAYDKRKKILFKKELYRAFEQQKIQEFQKNRRLKRLELLERLQVMGFYTIKDSREFLKLCNFEDDYIDKQEMLDIIEAKNKEADKDRFEIFIDSKHFLEACSLLKIKLESQSLISEIKCPRCSKKDLYKNTSNGNVYHCSCDFALFVDASKTERDVIDCILNKSLKLQKIKEGEYKTFYNYSIDKDYKDINNLSDLLSIFPLLATTAHSFSSVFRQKSSINNEPEVPESYFNYLIVDEAGMVLPSYMVNIFAGKRLILLGDTKQIEPVFPYGKNILINNRLIDVSCMNDAFFEQQIKINYSVLEQNAMSISNRAINVVDDNRERADDASPFWLLEHFRCAEPIIQFCNLLMYDNKIKPKKGYESEEGRATISRLEKFAKEIGSPKNCHIYFVNHNRKSKNHTNEAEKTIILNIIEKLKKLGFNDSDIGIVTPFRNQEKLINIRGMTGTVHKFQGSERRVMFFSSVTDSESQSPSSSLFMNRDMGNMLNVAVSRAKDLFILVGNKKAMTNDKSHSKTLVEYIEKYGYQIDDGENFLQSQKTSLRN